MNLIARIRVAWQNLNKPAPPRCRECGQSPPAVALAVGADYCVACSKPTPAELERIQRRLPGLASVNPSPYATLRRRDGSPLSLGTTRCGESSTR